MTLPTMDEAGPLISGIMEQFGIPGVGVAVVSGDESVAWGYGVCVKGESERVTADTTFQLASCSKAYTATSAAVLVDRGVIGWDDPVRKHLPEFQLHDACLSDMATLRDLLSMRLGYKNEGLVNWGRNTELGVEFIFERLRYMDVIAGFREKFTYLNPAYTLISEVIARRSGMPFIQFESENVFAPLGLTNTLIREGKYLPKRSHAFPHVTLEQGIEPLGEARCGGRLGESCVYSSANDAARWMRLHLGKGEIDGTRLVSQAAMDEMHRPHVYGPSVPELDNFFLAYGMGWQCRDTANGPILLHEGGEFGVSTFTILDPIRKIGACVYANAVRGAAVKSGTYSLIDLAAGRRPRDWASLFLKLDARDQEAMRGYLDKLFAGDSADEIPESEIIGSYFHPANGMLDIARVAGALDVRIRDGWVYDAELEPLRNNLYRSHCRYKGMQAMGRQMNLKMQVFRDDEGIALRAPGFGVFRKLDVPKA
jgi:CubicO group peptidase (beta-lactamase class C family)